MQVMHISIDAFPDTHGGLHGSSKPGDFRGYLIIGGMACVQVCASRLQGMGFGAQRLAHAELDPGVG